MDIMEQVSMAYGDKGAGMQGGQRNLSFDSDWCDDLDTVRRALVRIGKYNGFDGRQVGDDLGLHADRIVKCQVCRHSSPAMRVTVREAEDAPYIVQALRAARADSVYVMTGDQWVHELPTVYAYWG